MSKFNELVTKLREIFQIDRPELDFGVYRILNARADEINDYLENRLKDKVSEALSAKAKGDTESITKDLIAELRDEYGKRAFDDQGNLVDEEALASDAGKRLQDILSSSKGVADNENAVFSHLLTFFSRYYDQGDFISQRRYKGETYAIPYAGEEVMLHWANKDQYYTKSGENFSNYSFKLEDGRVVHFRLVAADTAKDNRKDNDKDRLFILAENRTIVRIDDEGAEYDDEVIPIEELSTTDADGNASTELIIRFDYKAVPKRTKQDKLISEAVDSILELDWVTSSWSELASRAPTEKNPKRTLFEKHLINYTAKNTADYFIHKNLGKFLRGELDFYIKNDVMNLDDVQEAEAYSDIEKNLRMIQCVRSIALDLINFLAQIEGFQKKLWTKKKFVVSSNFCLTLNLVPEKLLIEVVDNLQQWKQWNYLNVWEGDIPGTLEDLKTSQSLMIDTALFTTDFKYRLLSAIPDIDDCINGTIVNADNFQALALLSDKYASAVDFVYIDPPYNATTSEIAYKNGFKHGSWITLMENRLSNAKPFMSTDSMVCVAIDENERENLSLLMKELFSGGEMTQISVVHNPRGIQGNGFSVTNESAIFFRPEGKVLGKRSLKDSKSKPLMKTGSESERHTAKNCFYPIYVKGGVVVGFGDVPSDSFHPLSACTVEENDVQAIWPISSTDGLERKWRYARQSVESIIGDLEVKTGRNGLPSINLAKSMESYRTVWSDAEFNAAEYGSTLLKNILPGNEFTFPKSLYTVRHAIKAANCRSNGLVLDFFAGSGTTAHAVISLNRDEGIDLSYIMVEQGHYFDTVLKPRIQKIVYSADWSRGRATSPETGISHCFRVLKLESYEDALNNLVLNRNKTDLFNSIETKEDYLLNYMLNIESRGSVLCLDDFRKPFDYSMKIAVDSAGAFEKENIDLVETFNYLIGLKVSNYEFAIKLGYVRVEGLLPSGEKALVLWRDCEKVDYEKLREWENRLNIGAKDNPYDIIYINGDHNLSEIYSPTKEEGGETSVRVIRSIEPEFLTRMFAEEEI